MKDLDKKELRSNFEAACNAYASALNIMWSVGGYWAHNVGEVYLFANIEDYPITLDDLILCVDEEIAFDEFKEWSDYCDFAREYGQQNINLYSWHHGYRGVPKETQERLRKLKEELEEACKECKDLY